MVLLVVMYAASSLASTALAIAALSHRAAWHTKASLVIAMVSLAGWSALWAFQVWYQRDNGAPDAYATGWVWTLPWVAAAIAGFALLARSLTRPAPRYASASSYMYALHPLVMVGVALTPAGRDAIVSTGPDGAPSLAWGFWVHTAFAYALLTSTVVRVITVRDDVPALQSVRVWALVAAIAVPAVANLLSISWRGPTHPDFTSMAFVATAWFAWIAFLRRGLLDVVPVARTWVFQHMASAVLVTDAAGRIADLNRAAHTLVTAHGRPERAAVGTPLADAWPALATRRAAIHDRASFEWDIPGASPGVVLRVSVSDLRPEGHWMGEILQLDDVTAEATERRRLESQRRALSAEMEHDAQVRRDMERQLVRDAGTDLFNRRYVDEQLPRMLDDARRSGRELSIVLLDLDRFKRVNDRHGHSAGDRVLRDVACAMRRALPHEAKLARFGGEEFLAILPGVGAARAVEIAEDLRAACEALRIEVRGDVLQQTTSAGVVSLGALGAAEGAAVLIAHADQALYEAKDAGRNRVRHYQG